MLLVGIAMILLPGPACLVIPAGLAILATEFEWAHRLKMRFHAKFEEWKRRYQKKKEERAARKLMLPR